MNTDIQNHAIYFILNKLIHLTKGRLNYVMSFWGLYVERGRTLEEY